LSRHGCSADAFEWSCRLADRTMHEGSCAPAAPLSDPAAAAALVRSSLAAHPPRTAVEEITLRARPVRVATTQPGFDEPPRPSPRQLTATLARLSALVDARGIGSPVILDTHRPDAHQMTPFTLKPSPLRGEGRVRGGPMVRGGGDSVLAMRRLRPPRPVEVALAGGIPTHLHTAGLTGRIVAGAGPWRISGDWWTDAPFARDEWDVELADGTLCRLAREGRGWRLEAIYD
jgi:protein ImuB